MLYFALLACLVSLRSVPALLVATAIIAVHHISFSLLIPSLIYPTGGFRQNLVRTVFRAGVVVLETAALILTVLKLKGLEQEMKGKAEELAASLKTSNEARQQALSAQNDAEKSNAESLIAKQQAEMALLQSQEAETVRQNVKYACLLSPS